MTLLAVGIGGAIGAMLRYLVMGRIGHWLGINFPYGTLTVNILGSFIMGVLIVLFARMASVPQNIQALVTVGVLGGFTTFSTFSLDVATLLERGDYSPALLYILASVMGSIGAIFLGLIIARQVFPV